MFQICFSFVSSQYGTVCCIVQHQTLQPYITVLRFCCTVMMIMHSPCLNPCHISKLNKTYALDAHRRRVVQYVNSLHVKNSDFRIIFHKMTHQDYFHLIILIRKWLTIMFAALWLCVCALNTAKNVAYPVRTYGTVYWWGHVLLTVYGTARKGTVNV